LDTQPAIDNSSAQYLMKGATNIGVKADVHGEVLPGLEQAPVHFDDHDLIVVQLRGTKSWYVSNEPAGLNNTWQTIPGDPLKLGDHTTIDVLPGDLLYRREAHRTA
jgi:hypothetical protein